MTTLGQLKNAAQHPNVQAFLRVIRQGESDQSDGAYRRRYHPTQVVYFDDLSQHPHIFERTPNGQQSSAAGAYQITWTTWSGLVKQYDFPDFTPPTQDLAAIALIAERKALAPLFAGDLAEACRRCTQDDPETKVIEGPMWTSLPGGSENPQKYAHALSVYEQYGGRVGPPAPIEDVDLSNVPPRVEPIAPDDPLPIADEPKEPTMSGFGDVLGQVAGVALNAFVPGSGLIVGLASSLIDAFSPLAKEKIQKEMARHTDNPEVAGKIADGIINAVKQVTGKADPIEAVASARNDPAVMAQVEAATVQRLNDMAPFLEQVSKFDQQKWDAETAGRNAAAQRAQAEKWDMTRVLVWFAGVGNTVLDVGLLGALLYAWFGKDVPPNTVIAIIGLAGPLLAGSKQAWKEIFAYRFDGTKTSEASNAAVAQIATSK